jgi:quercetin dioxygenase-like cupin family protein
MTKYFAKEELSWVESAVRGGTIMRKSNIREGDFDIRSAYFRMPKGMIIPSHTHSSWVQVVVLEGQMQIETEDDGIVSVAAGGSYFVEPEETHIETAMEDTLVLVTQGEDRPDFIK